MIYLSFDTETYVDDTVMPAKMVCGQFGTRGSAEVLPRDEALAKVYRALIRDDIVLVGHHIAFDLSVVANERPEWMPLIFAKYRKGLVRCTMTRQRLLNIREGDIHFIRHKNKFIKAKYDLGTLSRVYLGRQMSKGEDSVRMRYHEVDDLPVEHWPDDFYQYAVQDARDTYDVFIAQGPDLISPDEIQQTESAWDLHLEAVEGIKVDPARYRQVEQDLEREREELQGVLLKGGLLKLKSKTKPENGFSANMKAIREVVAQGFADPPKTKTGAVKTDGDTLERAAAALAPDNPDHILLQYRAYKKIEKTQGYLKTLEPGTRYRLHSRPNVLVATGRTSWSQPNLQQLPRAAGLRECIVAPDGHALLACDYDSLELRALAQVLLDLTGSSQLAGHYQRDPDFDPHTNLASQILGVSYEDGLALKAAKDKRLLATRQMSKAANFGYPGGMGVEKFILFAFQSYGVTLSYDQAYKLREDWFAANPEMRDYFNLINSYKGGSIKQLRSGRVRGNVGFCDGANSFFQGLAADGAKHALRLITRECYTDRSSPLYGSRPVVFVHDENILYTPLDRVADAGKRLAELMIEGMAKYIPNVPIRCETAAADHWSKSMEPVYDEEGRLTLWTP